MNVQNDINAYATMEQNLKSELQDWMGSLNFTAAAKEKMIKMIKFKIYNTTMYAATRGGGRRGSCVKQNLQYAYVLQLNPMYKNVRVKLIHFENPLLFHVFIVAVKSSSRIFLIFPIRVSVNFAFIFIFSSLY